MAFARTGGLRRPLVAVAGALAMCAGSFAGSIPTAEASTRVTIIGDSVTMDARPDLVADIRSAVVHAFVSEQWDDGVGYAQQLKAQGRLGAVVVIALGTNGPISSSGMSQMLRELSGRRVVLVTNHLPMWWQHTNNRLLRTTARDRKDVVVADWASLAADHPGWFGSDGVHMPIGGAGAQAFARLVASRV